MNKFQYMNPVCVMATGVHGVVVKVIPELHLQSWSYRIEFQDPDGRTVESKHRESELCDSLAYRPPAVKVSRIQRLQRWLFSWLAR